MTMSVTGSLASFAYQNTLSQTGDPNKALIQALASGQSQAADMGSLLASAGSVDPIAALSGGPSSEALTSLAFGASAASGNASSSIQAMLSSLGNSSSGLFSNSQDGLPVSAAALSPTTTQAMVRYAYDQSQNPADTIQQTLASAQQALFTSSLNLLA